MKEIAVIGAGASGQAAAITMKREDPEARVTIFEKNPLPGKKLRATGNGRCNMTNAGSPDAGQVLSFFASLGIITTEDEEGRIYPYSRSAEDVQRALMYGMESWGVEICTGAAVTELSRKRRSEGFRLAFRRGKEEHARDFDKVLLACGGKAGPRFGTCGDGYAIARALGHNVTRLAPCLTGVRVMEETEDLAGMRAKAVVTLKRDGVTVFQEAGEVQFTEYGLSGICIFNLSRHLEVIKGLDLRRSMERYIISIDFLPDVSDAAAMLDQRKELKALQGPDMLLSMVKEPIRKRIYEDSGGDTEKMAGMLKAMTFVPEMPMGWNHAQVTKGGVDYNEVDSETMESKLVPGLYLAGEILDYEGPCGGYNLQHAFHTGIKAGRAMIK